MNIIELHRHIVQAILLRLDVSSVCRTLQVCNELRRSGADDGFWRCFALLTWPLDTVCLEHYHCYKELVLDSNARVVVEQLMIAQSLHVPGPSSSYRHNKDLQFYDCKCISLEWDRKHDLFRLYFDARGERDMPHPLTSSLAVAMVCPGTSGDAVTAGDVCDGLHPDRVELYSDVKGHYKGHMEWAASVVLQVLDKAHQQRTCIAALDAHEQSTSWASCGAAARAEPRGYGVLQLPSRCRCTRPHSPLCGTGVAGGAGTCLYCCGEGAGEECGSPTGSSCSSGTVERGLCGLGGDACSYGAVSISSATSASTSSSCSTDATTSTADSGERRRSDDGDMPPPRLSPCSCQTGHTSAGVGCAEGGRTVALMFCYGNHLAAYADAVAFRGSPLSAVTTFQPVTLLRLSPGQGVREVWEGARGFERIGATEGALREEGFEQEAARWADLPLGVQSRMDWWR